MQKQLKSKLNEFGSLMIEAMAMLALISMVTPILYKKSAERTTELQDINAASEVRALIKSLDDYVSDHYDDIIQGKTVTQNCNTASVNYNGMKATSGASTQKMSVNLNHFCEYLPYGFLDSSKNVQDTKTFSKNYQVVLKKVDGGDGRKRVVTAFLITEPSDGGTFPKLRASRIASMIGSNGGYINVANNVASAMGTQGIWSVNNLNSELGIAANKVKDGAIIASSVQGIAAQGGVDNENVLYRKWRSNRELNTMETTLLMGANAAQGQNIINVNQMIIEAGRPGNFETGTSEADHALYVKKGGATIKGGIKAADALFTVDTAGKTTAVEFVAGNFDAKQDLLKLGDAFTATNSGLTVKYNGGTWGDETGVTDAPVNINANTKITGNLHVTGNEYVGGNLRVKGTIDADKLHARTQLTVGGTPSAPTNAVVTETSSVFKQPDFRIGGNNKNDARLFTSATESVLRGGTGGLLLDSSQNVTMQSAAAGGITVTAGTGHLNMSSTGQVNITSGTADASPISLNGQMMQLMRTSNKIESIINYYRIATSAGGDTQAFINPGGKQLLTKNMKLQVQDPKGGDILVVDPLTQDKGAATMKGKLTVTNTDETQLFQVTPNNQTEDISTVNVSNDYLRVNKLKGGTNVLTVDTTGALKSAEVTDDKDKQDKNKGPVYIRKGVMELATNTDGGVRDLSEHQGYVKADRFVANKALAVNALAKPVGLGYTFVGDSDASYTGVNADGTSKNNGAYDYYQVNPAYTSVMHDIKLTTRGGARLSDILPDFINKGIYIVDNTYRADAVGDSWAKRTTEGYHVMGDSNSPFNPLKGYTDCGTTHSCEVSPWAGFVPAPQCPPGYMKVITLTPATFSMAQAGIPGPLLKDKYTASDVPDLIIDYNVRDPNEYVEGATSVGKKSYNTPSYVTTAPTPLYFQKNTWLRSMVIPYLEGSKSAQFRGWSAVMGFIYPYTYYKKYIELLGMTPTGANNKTVIWNLFPVYNQTLEGYATVYCYFNRDESIWDPSLVDKSYDQLGSWRPVYDKSNTTYTGRLNDKTLGYTDPW